MKIFHILGSISENPFCSDIEWKILDSHESSTKWYVIENTGIRAVKGNFLLMTEGKTIVLTKLCFKVCWVLQAFQSASGCSSQEWNWWSHLRIFSHNSSICLFCVNKNPFGKQIKYGRRYLPSPRTVFPSSNEWDCFSEGLFLYH